MSSLVLLLYFVFFGIHITKAEEEVKIDSPLPAAAFKWDANIRFTNFTPTQEQKVIQAISLIKKVFAAPKFRDQILNHTFDGRKKFIDAEGRSNEEIYQIILEGAERMGITASNNKMDVELELYYDTSNTIGYTYPNVTKIWMNKKYFNKYSPVQVAGNLTHEWLHKLGFGHSMTWSKSRDASVPYAIGYLMEKMAREIQ